MIEPSGVYWVCLSMALMNKYVKAILIIYFQGYHGCAVGKGKSVAKTEIEKLKLEEMSVRDAVREAARM